jgi:hypothetical protein
MSTEKPHNENAKPKPKPKKRQPMKKQQAQTDRWAATFVILGCVGAATSALCMYYHAENALIWATFATILFFLLAIYYHWQTPFVSFLCAIFVAFAFLGCFFWQIDTYYDARRVAKTALSPSPELTPVQSPLRKALL